MSSDMATYNERDSEWEYEYDENETEDYYFTLDLTIHAPGAVEDKQYSKNGKRLPPKKAANKNPSHPVRDAAVQPSQEATESQPPSKDDNPSSKPNTFQVLDLHTPHPYINYNNNFFACHWHTDLGTQLWISKPGVVDDPRFAGHILDVIASSQARLVGRPADLKRKRTEYDSDNATSEDREPPQTTSIPASTPEASSAHPKSLRIQQKLTDPHLRGQANFIQRLSALRMQKGESDALRIPLQMPKYYHGAVNPGELRDAARRKDAEAAGKAVDETELAPPIGSAFAKRRSGGGADVGWKRTPVRGDQDEFPGYGTGDAAMGTGVETELAAARAEARQMKAVKNTRTRGGRRAGKPSHASLRQGLGLPMAGLGPKKRGRPRKVGGWGEGVVGVEDLGEGEGREGEAGGGPSSTREDASVTEVVDDTQSATAPADLEMPEEPSPRPLSQDLDDESHDDDDDDDNSEDDSPSSPDDEDIDDPLSPTASPSTPNPTWTPQPPAYPPPLTKPRRRRTASEIAASRAATLALRSAPDKPKHRRRTRTQMAEHRISEALSNNQLELAASLRAAETARQERLKGNMTRGAKRKSEERKRRRQEGQGETRETDFRGEVLVKGRRGKRGREEIEEEERRGRRAWERVVVPGQVGVELPAWRLEGWGGGMEREGRESVGEGERVVDEREAAEDGAGERSAEMEGGGEPGA